jgi:lipopolysaccharide transport system ATP-binding protein
MTSTSIRVEGLGKRYRLVMGEERPSSWREAAMSLLSSPFAYLRHTLRPPSQDEILWALKDVSFKVEQGEVVGILGRNGAGKSTLLKILSRITDPTDGRAIVRGRVGSLLEVGTGMHPELTGRENIYFSGVVLGMTTREIDRKFEEIVEFANLDRFIDTPVKRYSSGMHVRLAFAVAAQLEPEIMIMDEVLAVGDVSFRKKSQEKLRSAANDGRTVLFVSHAMETMASLCPRAIWLDGGRLVADGPSSDVIEAYLSASASDAPGISARHGLTIHKVTLRDEAGETAHHFYPTDALTIEVEYTAAHRLERPYIWFTIDSDRGPCFGANMYLDGNNVAILDGPGRLSCTFKSLPLIPQAYRVRMAIRREESSDAIVEPQEVATFSVIGDLNDYGLPAATAHVMAPMSVPTVIPYEWKLPDGQMIPVSLRRS